MCQWLPTGSTRTRFLTGIGHGCGPTSDSVSLFSRMIEVCRCPPEPRNRYAAMCVGVCGLAADEDADVVGHPEGAGR